MYLCGLSGLYYKYNLLSNEKQDSNLQFREVSCNILHGQQVTMLTDKL